MTIVQIIEHVKKHFDEDNNPLCFANKYSGYPSCLYNQTGCAIGCLLTQEDANLLEQQYGGMGVNSVSGYVFRFLTERGYVTFDSTSILTQLQVAHDSAVLSNNDKRTFLQEIDRIHNEFKRSSDASNS